MNTNLLSNKELDNYSVEDSFNFLVKADAIKIFLENNSTSLEKNKMLVLYGDWGSGKTSLMKHIESEISKDIYFPIFFHAWEHEKDENLPLSLCDALTASIENNNEIIKGFMKGALLTLKSFTSGVTLKAPGFLTGLGLDFEFSGEKYIKAIDDALKNTGQISFYKSNEEFKANFRKVEELILQKSGAQKILIFVDDLDRCEPENVLNLITALKLFFTYGDKTIYFCGIDKEAITKAVKTKYQDVVKSEEYMEKVFDISFNMPKTYSLSKMLQPYFFNIEIKSSDGHTYLSTAVIEDFFRSIEFTNPRHLKKILNKYEIIKSFKSLTQIPEDIRSLIPNIIKSDRDGQIFETIYCLFIIILYEFYYMDFIDLENYEQRFFKYVDVMFNTISNSGRENISANLNAFMYLNNVENLTFDNIESLSAKGAQKYGFVKFLFIFSHSHPGNLGFISNDSLNKYSEYFNDGNITSRFCRFLIKHKSTITVESKDSNYIIWNLFNMVKYLL